MMKKTHLIFGALFFIIAWLYFDIPAELSAFALIGAMIPDLDLGFMHRKILHNLWVLGIMNIGLLLYGLNGVACLVFSLGFISHLVADSMTVQGISFFWPFRFMHIEGGITTGGIIEFILSGFILGIIFVLLYGIDAIINLSGLL